MDFKNGLKCIVETVLKGWLHLSTHLWVDKAKFVKFSLFYFCLQIWELSKVTFNLIISLLNLSRPLQTIFWTCLGGKLSAFTATHIWTFCNLQFNVFKMYFSVLRFFLYFYIFCKNNNKVNEVLFSFIFFSSFCSVRYRTIVVWLQT